MTPVRLLLLAAALTAALLAGASPAISQTTRGNTRPAPSGTQDSAKKTPVTSSTAKSGQSGKSTPIPSTSKQNAPKQTQQKQEEAQEPEEKAPRVARSASSTKGDKKTALPPSGKVGDAPPALPPMPTAPSWIDKVTVDEQKYIDEVLNYWQASTAKINTYRCEFQKYTYNPNFAPAGVHYEYSTGVIMYAKPDKGMYRVDEIHRYRQPKKEGDAPEHVKAEGEKGEHWICDGEAVYYFDYLNKILRKTNLPPIMRGKAIADGPLPFVFGADAKKIKDRYWLHVVTPKESTDEIHLAAVPKTREDAANYKEIKIIIDHKEFLPKAMIVFLPGYDAKKNPAKESYLFKKRENNLAREIWETLQGQFYQPKLPAEWKLEEQEVPRDEAPRTAANPKIPPITSSSKNGGKAKP